MKPAPRPWRTGRHPDHDCSVRYVLDANGDEVCSTFNDLEENVANVDCIVRACNAHDDLLGALKAIRDSDEGKPWKMVGLAERAIAQLWLNTNRLTQAEGE